MFLDYACDCIMLLELSIGIINSEFTQNVNFEVPGQGVHHKCTSILMWMGIYCIVFGSTYWSYVLEVDYIGRVLVCK
jgi:hypothetical protein